MKQIAESYGLIDAAVVVNGTSKWLSPFAFSTWEQPSICSYQHHCTASLLPWEHADVSSCFVVGVRACVRVVAKPTSGFLFSSMRTVAPFVSFHEIEV